MNATEGELDFPRPAGQFTEIPFNADDLSREITKLTHARLCVADHGGIDGHPGAGAGGFFDGATFNCLQPARPVAG